MICGQVTAEPFVSSVPLSCVPPWMCFGLSGATERLWNWSVESPLLRVKRCEGTADSNCWHVARLIGPRGRLLHCGEMSENVPLDRTSPPSEPKMAPFVPGISTIAWLSGCMPLGAIGFGWQHEPG